MDLPGMTRYIQEENKCAPFTESSLQKQALEKPIILLATALITEDTIFMNGLFQNVYVLYRMFEAMGCLPIMAVNTKPENLNKIPKYMFDIRIQSCEDLVKVAIPVKLYIEIGMSVEQGLHHYLKMCGAKICKLYLGNILNIDIETPIFLPQMFFAHHVKGRMDEIWTSPHYHQHAQYARALNNVDIEKDGSIVAPYVWDYQVLTNDGNRNYKWKPASKTEDDVFLVLEPNISFQKCSLIPLMIIEAWYRKNPDWKGKVVVVNGERLKHVPFFNKTILENLDLYKNGRIELKGRLDILTLLNTYPSAIPICHQWNNEYNYMVLEYFYSGYPVLHNASDWSPYGYFYDNSNFEKAVTQIELIRKSHKQNFEVYKAHARQLIWKHSPYNPDIHKSWAKVAGL
jgi:hypothetical protein